MNLQILPLAVTMMAGPQIMSALILTTSKRPIANPAAFVAGVVVAASAGVALYTAIGSWLGSVVNLGNNSGPTTAAKIIQIILVGLLVALAIKTYLGRKTAKEPKWMAGLFESTPKKAFILAVGLIFLMPTDIAAMLTVGINLASNNLGFLDAIPFLLLTTFIAALPLLAYLVFYRKAQIFMPKVRDWMRQNSWLVNIFVYALFVYLIL